MSSTKLETGKLYEKTTAGSWKAWERWSPEGGAMHQHPVEPGCLFILLKKDISFRDMVGYKVLLQDGTVVWLFFDNGTEFARGIARIN